MITTAEETATEGPRINDNHQDQEGDGQRIVDIGVTGDGNNQDFGLL
jgi:hypothetical protein